MALRSLAVVTHSSLQYFRDDFTCREHSAHVLMGFGFGSRMGCARRPTLAAHAVEQYFDSRRATVAVAPHSGHLIGYRRWPRCQAL
ncbi:hypothetical protein [Rhodococcus qingshengii]|uniref:hypothetical protein n=1 Tax=Rhodococcus qingshengii TaxID=334542 RepID=UPI001ADF00EE|nr:hypothetical protein [Rhodococcus qingshengii]